MIMDTARYRNFIAIAEEGNLTKAAKKLQIAQPALSNQLKGMEQEFGAQLMTRSARRMELTDAGKILYEKARYIAALETSAKKEIIDCSSGFSGTLRLGLTFSNATTFQDGLLLQFQRQYPQIRYQIYEAETREIIGLLQSGVIEIGIARSPFQASLELEIFHGKPDQFAAVFHRKTFGNTLCGREISLQNLKSLPLCITRRFESMFISACLGDGFLPNVLCVNTQLLNSILWAKHGIAVAIVPHSTYVALKDDTIGCSLIKDSTLKTTLAILTTKGRYLSCVATHFLDLCKQPQV